MTQAPLVNQCAGPCGRCYALLVLTPKGAYCPSCWYRAGCPEPFPRAESLEEAEEATRRRMIKRGGEDRYRALAGKS